MEEKKHSVKDLFIKLAERKSTQEERLRLIAWLEKDPVPSEFPSVEELLETGNGRVMPPEAAANVFNTIMQHSPATPVIPLWKRTRFRIAAALIPFVGLASLAIVYYREKDNRRHFVNNTRQVQTIQLEDGTVIRLNQRSSMAVKTNDQRREVWLEGEAFFTVKHQATQPFIVHAANLVDISVLGTAFNVNTRNGNAAVVLNEGSVKVNAGKTASLLLKPGEMAAFNNNTRVLSKQPVDTLFQTSWKYNLLAFKSQTLKTVMQQLGEQYDYKVAFEAEGIENLLFTGYLPSDNLQQAILTIEQSFNLKFVLQHKIIYVNNKNL
ncbi:FecR family protein [Chitinophaga sp. RAB17]|uniref:FecR family protein n=1 Tax=Chitinophaga sp. RAB17 TaxID=3233049 RepID=UPI003F91CF1E